MVEASNIKGLGLFSVFSEAHLEELAKITEKKTYKGASMSMNVATPPDTSLW